MVTFNLSYTVPINIPGTQPLLTQSQVWECMKRKVRNASDFVAGITKTEILSETITPDGGLVIERRVTFAPRFHPAGAEDAVETCKLYEPCRIDFVAADGSTITSVVSSGPTAKPEDLHYTYVFEWRHKHIEDYNSDEAVTQRGVDWDITQATVNITVDTMRRLVREGVV
ncbi:hypothetical protein GQX73_g9358 [Xylaria multiplex]|uniref:DUF1857-domain-containing protein n=1 Tax=Xylaria multiplex TaxID=323545 RepID=A0A7C8MYW5_9PEZI|nr:hypothetical protein GQX73_g9358 [Xylaria multiplex]